MPNEEMEKMVEDSADRLMEHFDSVRIFVTVHRGDKESTKGITKGRGNYYAQIGQVREFIIRDDKQTRMEEEKENE